MSTSEAKSSRRVSLSISGGKKKRGKRHSVKNVSLASIMSSQSNRNPKLSSISEDAPLDNMPDKLTPQAPDDNDEVDLFHLVGSRMNKRRGSIQSIASQDPEAKDMLLAAHAAELVDVKFVFSCYFFFIC